MLRGLRRERNEEVNQNTRIEFKKVTHLSCRTVQNSHEYATIKIIRWFQSILATILQISYYSINGNKQIRIMVMLQMIIYNKVDDLDHKIHEVIGDEQYKAIKIIWQLFKYLEKDCVNLYVKYYLSTWNTYCSKEQIQSKNLRVVIPKKVLSLNKIQASLTYQTGTVSLYQGIYKPITHSIIE